MNDLQRKALRQAVAILDSARSRVCCNYPTDDPKKSEELKTAFSEIIEAQDWVRSAYTSTTD